MRYCFAAVSVFCSLLPYYQLVISSELDTGSIQLKCASSFLCIYYCSKLHHRQLHHKVYLISRLPNVLWNCYFLSKPLFQVSTWAIHQGGALLKKCFHFMPLPKLLHQNCFLRVALKKTIYRRMQKHSFLRNLKKISILVPNFSTATAEKPTI